MDNILEVRGLKMHFGGVKAVDELSFDVHRHELLGVIGPNGSGKTTMFNALTGVYKPTDGKVNFSLEQCKQLYIYTTEHKVRLLGAKSDPEHPGCNAAWLNLPNLWKFYIDIVESFDTVTNKKDLKNLLWSWENYMNCIAQWFYLSFPWEIGQLTKDRITQVSDAENQLDFARDIEAYVKQ